MSTNLCFQEFVTIINHSNCQILAYLSSFTTSLANSTISVLSCCTAARILGLEHLARSANSNVSPRHPHIVEMSALDMALFGPNAYGCREN